MNSKVKQISNIVIALMLVAGLFAPSFDAQAAPSTAINNHVVQLSSPDWVIVQETAGVGTAGFMAGPATPPIGSGSFNVQLNDGGVGIALIAQKYGGTKLDDIATLTYSTYTNSSTQAISFQINYDPDLTTVEATWYGRLVYEPYLNGSVTTNTWQTWDMINGGNGLWWATGAPVNVTCPISSPCTWDDLIATWPDIGVRNDFNTAILFKAGAGWNGFNGNVDNFTFEIAGGDTDIYDFEPEVQCTTTCYVDTVNGDNAFGGSTPASAKKTIQAAMAQVSVGGTIHVAPGTYHENVVINKNGISLIGAVALNPGVTVNPSTHTIIDGSSAPAVGGSPGILVSNGVTDVTIRNLRVQLFATSSGIYGGQGNNGLLIENVHTYNNNNAINAHGGIMINGPVNGVTINNVDARHNFSRGIVIWNGFKQNITITNNYVANNTCCGIELQDGTASGVTISGNTVINNADNGIAATGLMAGAGPNVISNNTVTDNGRFGIEIKLPDGTGTASGDGSIVVANNNVSLTATPANLLDYAGIAVIRRGWVASSGNVDIPTGVIVQNNTVSGFVQSNGASSSTGFGIVAEGLNMYVLNNTLTGNDVGVQAQAGHTPYTPNSNVDGNQNDMADDYFGRGNSPVACVSVSGNLFTSNTVDFRRVGTTDCAATLIVPSTDPIDNVVLSSATSSLTVNFSEDVIHDGSADAADNVANYLLVEQGANNTFDTLSCLGGVVSDDVAQTIASAVYDNNGGAGPFVATLTTASPLSNGVYRLFICGTTSIWSSTGLELNGGTSDTTITFTVSVSATAAGTAASAAAAASALPATGFAPGLALDLPAQPAAKAYASTDLTLSIPRLGLTSQILGVPRVGGEWDVSWLGNSVGYLNGTTFPTLPGNTVLTAHVWGADNRPGPFYGLDGLSHGDQFSINAWGRTYTYEVRTNQLYSPSYVKALASGGDNYDWVTLITCHGYDEAKGTYDYRRVVRAVLVSIN
ncbi:MAG: sortase [Anaerolineales bacterium]|nr:sortase [Anaerolineales bacterium]